MGRIALEIPLGAFPVIGRRQGDGAHRTRVQALRDALGDPALAGGIAAFKEDDHAVTRARHPVLPLHRLALEAQQLTEIALAALRVAISGRCALGTGKVILEPVVGIKFELFIVGVEQFALEAPIDFGDVCMRQIRRSGRGTGFRGRHRCSAGSTGHYGLGIVTSG
jgi:hypothetical protein